MRRLVTLAGGVALAGPLLVAVPALASGPCDLDGGRMIVTSEGDDFQLGVDATDEAVVGLADNVPICSYARDEVDEIVLADATGSISVWQVKADSPFPAPVLVSNDDGDIVSVIGSPGVDRWRNAGRGVIDLDLDPTTDNRVETARVPMVTNLELGDGADDVRMAGDEPWAGKLAVRGSGSEAKVVWGGDGDDFVTLGRGADEVRGFGGSDYLQSGIGRDVVDGGPGADEISAGKSDDLVVDPLVGDDPDTVVGGPGVDTVDYSGRDRGVWAALGEHDAVGPAPAYADVTAEVERIVGTAKPDTLYAGDGGGVLSGGGGGDLLVGGAAPDTLQGGGGADRLRGARGGRDLLDGGAGRDGASWDAADVRRSVEFRLR